MNIFFFSSWCHCSVAPLCPTLCEPMDCGMPGFPILHYLPFAQNHVHWSQWYHPTISGSSVVPFSSCLPRGISLTLCVLLLELTLNHLLCGFLWMCDLYQMGYHLVPLDRLWDSQLTRLVYNWQLCPFTDSMTYGLATDPCEPQVLLWMLADIMWENGVGLSHMPFKCYFIKKKYFLSNTFWRKWCVDCCSHNRGEMMLR